MRKLFAATTRVRRSLKSVKPEFTFRVGWAPSYERLLESAFTRTAGIESVLDESLANGRVIVHGEAGSGKTHILHRLFLLARRREIWPVVVSLQNWQANHFDEWGRNPRSELRRMAMLLSTLAEPPVSEELLDELGESSRHVVLVDGLNELPSNVAQEIIDVLDAFARRVPLAAVIVSDRLVRRSVRVDRWKLARVRPIDRAQIVNLISSLPGGAKAGAKNSRLLELAYFLDVALKEGLPFFTSAPTQQVFFSDRLNLSPHEMERVARAAYEAYRTVQARTFPVGPFRKIAGSVSTQKLRKSGALNVEGGTAHFRHHLQHDYLAASHVARSSMMWTHTSFDLLTFHASSFDALGLVLEQVAGSDAADLFIRRVYDWNFYGAAYVLERGRRLRSVGVSSEMETAILAMLGEKRWDIVRATARRVTDSLRLYPSPMARKFLSAKSLTGTMAIVKRAKGSKPWFEEWRRVFTSPEGTTISTAELAGLEHRDSLIGWTLANILKRTTLSASQLARIRGFMRSSEDTVRWRVVHVLGAHPTKANVGTLIRAFDEDRYRWVRYGAIRSLVEAAARSADPSLRLHIFEALRRRAKRIIDEKASAAEFERAIFVSRPPSDWADVVEPVLESLWRHAPLDESEHWASVAFTFRTRLKDGEEAVVG